MMLRKILVAVMVCSLIGQGALPAFAGERNEDSKTVRQYRDGAREAVSASANPRVLEWAVSAVLGGGLTAAGVKIWYAHHKSPTQRQLQEQLHRDKKEIRFLKNKVAGLSRQQTVNAQRIAEGQLKIQTLSKELDNALAETMAAQKGLQVLKEFFGKKLYVAKYAELHGKTLDELEAVLPAMLREDFQPLGNKALMKELTWLERELLTTLTIPDPVTAGTYMQFLSSRAIYDKTAVFLRSLSQRLGAKHVLILGLVFGAGVALQQVDSGLKQAERLSNNPSLLLSMTDEEARQLEDSPSVKAMCALIEETYVSLGNLSEEELNLLAQAMPQHRSIGRDVQLAR